MARLRTRGILPLLALGVSLARRGIMPAIAMTISALTALLLAVLAFVLASRSASPPLHDVPILASSAMAWGGGFFHAFSVAVHALRKDRAEGIRDLLALRTSSVRGYLVARVGGLAAVLAAWIGGGTLFAGLFSLAAGRTSSLLPTLQATGASLAFAVAFSAVIAPVAIAAVGARSRIGGYLLLLFVVGFPELVAGALSGVLPDAITDVLAIPSALGALRSSLAPGGLDPLRALRATVALGLFAAVAVFVVDREIARLEQTEAEA